MTPTSRSLAELRALGYTAEVTEKWNPHAMLRHDLFGFIDILAIRPDEIFGVQATGRSASTRLKKARGCPALREWLRAGGRFEVWSWAMRGKRGKRKTYTLSRRPITLEDLEEEWTPAI